MSPLNLYVGSNLLFSATTKIGAVAPGLTAIATYVKEDSDKKVIENTVKVGVLSPFVLTGDVWLGNLLSGVHLGLKAYASIFLKYLAGAALGGGIALAGLLALSYLTMEATPDDPYSFKGVYRNVKNTLYDWVDAVRTIPRKFDIKKGIVRSSAYLGSLILSAPFYYLGVKLPIPANEYGINKWTIVHFIGGALTSIPRFIYGLFKKEESTEETLKRSTVWGTFGHAIAELQDFPARHMYPSFEAYLGDTLIDIAAGGVGALVASTIGALAVYTSKYVRKAYDAIKNVGNVGYGNPHNRRS